MENYGSFSHSLSNYAALMIFFSSKKIIFCILFLFDERKLLKMRCRKPAQSEISDINCLTSQFLPLGDYRVKFELLIDNNPW